MNTSSQDLQQQRSNGQNPALQPGVPEAREPQAAETRDTPPQTQAQAQPQRRGGADARRAEDRSALLPPVDVVEDPTGITLWADMPGAERETLNIDVNGDTLTIEAEFSLGESAGTQPMYVEVRSPRYRRSFTLSRELDATRIEAVLKDGVLRLRVPKLEAAQPRRIEVRAG